MKVRPATDEDMESIYMMGFDVWAEGETKEQYLQTCRTLPKYKRGTWYVLEDDDRKIVSSLISYKDGFGLAAGSAGFGSIATSIDQRKKGYAALLIKGVLDLLDKEVEHIFLYSDITPSFYHQFNFQSLSAEFQKHSPSTCMVRGDMKKLPSIPSYF